MEKFVKKPCKNCPFRSDVKPFLHPEYAEEIAYAAENPYSDFFCHKTVEYDDEIDDTVVIDGSMLCAGFLTLRAQLGENTPNGFEPSWDQCYIDPGEMIEAYYEEWENRRSHKTAIQ